MYKNEASGRHNKYYQNCRHCNTYCTPDVEFRENPTPNFFENLATMSLNDKEKTSQAY
jgi:hypothetical protein